MNMNISILKQTMTDCFPFSSQFAVRSCQVAVVQFDVIQSQRGKA